MPITYDVETDYLYIIGFKLGLEQGKLQVSILVIRNMLHKSFGLSLIAEILNLKKDFVIQIQEELKKEIFILKRLKKRQRVKTIAKALKVSPLLVEVIKETTNKKGN